MNTRNLCGLARFLPALFLAGCLSSAPQAPENWTIEWRPGAETAPDPTVQPLQLTMRVADICVRAPYGGVRLAVLRANGSLAFDPYNIFAAAPSQLLRGAAFDALNRSGRFSRVVDHSSSAHADLDAEIFVTRLALDCRAPSRRDALVELSLAFVSKGEVLSVASGRSSVPVEDGNYSEGFSRAFSEALIAAAKAQKPDQPK